MHAGVWSRCLFGEGRAIRQVAENRGAIWIGLVLVLLTAAARSYDQTFIGDNPLLWLFGPLLFSVVSGTWVYVVVYGVFSRWRMGDAVKRPGFWSGWRGFMGLFWMTAPIAWLYAIPVERFLDAVTAAKANVFLLSTVSLWRVLVITRVVQHLTRGPFWLVLTWVWFAAAVEALVVFFFGGTFAQAIMRGMGGMRNSPAEEILLSTMSMAFGGAFWTAPVALLLSLLLRPTEPLQELPAMVTTRFPIASLVVAAIFWVGVSIIPQVELARNSTVEKLLAEKNPRAALDYLARHQPGQFAPARTLPPKPYEHSVFEQLPMCLDAVQRADPAWVRGFLVQRLNETMVHYRPRWGGLRTNTVTEQVGSVRDGLRRYHQDTEDFTKLLDGLERIPEGQAWLATNAIFLRAVQLLARDLSDPARPGHQPGESQQSNLLSLSNRIHGLLSAFPEATSTNRLEQPGELMDRMRPAP